MAYNIADDDRRKIAALEAALQASLAPGQWEQVRRLASLSRDEAWHQAIDAEVERIEEIARHFPAMAPAIRAVGQHLTQQQISDAGRCCSSSPLKEALHRFSSN
jgi:hypothetical protein